MGLTREQLEARRQCVGASDVAAICGENRFKSIVDVWMEKVYGVDESSSSEAADIGNALEDACAVLAAKALGVNVNREDLVRSHAGTRLVVNLDAWYVDDHGQEIPIECKTAGILHGWADALTEWGDAWTDEVPAHYLLQCTAQMIATDAPYCYLSAIIGNRGHVMFRIERDESLCIMILDAVESFWACVESQIKPEIYEVGPSVEVLKKIRRAPGSVCELDAPSREAVIEWQAARRARLDAEQREDAAKSAVLESLGNCDAALIPWMAGEVERLAEAAGIDDLTKAQQMFALTFMPQGRVDVDVNLLRAKYPEVYAACERRTTYRVLRLGKPKADMHVNVAPASTAKEGGAA